MRNITQGLKYLVKIVDKFYKYLAKANVKKYEKMYL
jgi:hypothetical protein